MSLEVAICLVCEGEGGCETLAQGITFIRKQLP